MGGQRIGIEFSGFLEGCAGKEVGKVPLSLRFLGISIYLCVWRGELDLLYGVHIWK